MRGLSASCNLPHCDKTIFLPLPLQPSCYYLSAAAPATILLLSVCRCLCCCITTIYQPLHIILLSRDHPPMAGSTAPHASTPSAKPDSRAIAFRISSPTLLPTVCRRSVSCAIYCACISRSAFTTSDSKFRADSRTAPAP